MRALITIISLPLKGRLGNKNNNNCGGGLGGSHAYGLTAIEDLMWLELDHRDLWAVSGRDLTHSSLISHFSIIEFAQKHTFQAIFLAKRAVSIFFAVHTRLYLIAHGTDPI